MPFDQLTPYLPTIAIAAGAALFLWGQRDRLKSLVAGLKPAPEAEAPMTATDRFETFYALRAWCEKAGHAGAVKVLDTQVLPTIVRGSAEPEGGSKP